MESIESRGNLREGKDESRVNLSEIQRESSKAIARESKGNLEGVGGRDYKRNLNEF